MASIVPIFVPHAGCPCQCVFCNQRTIAGQKQRMTPAQARGILQHAHAILPAGNIPQAAFYGGSFTAIPVEQQRSCSPSRMNFLRRERFLLFASLHGRMR